MANTTDKLSNVILFFVGHDSVSDLGLTKLWHLTYHADTSMARDFGGASITCSTYIKDPQGATPSTGEKQIAEFEKTGLLQPRRTQLQDNPRWTANQSAKARKSSLSEAELRVLCTVVDQHGRLATSELSKQIRLEPAWIHAENQGALAPALMLYGPDEDPEGL